MYGKTTCLVPLSNDEPKLTGKEVYPIVGPPSEMSLFLEAEYGSIMKKMKGLNRHYSCLEKALIVRSHIQGGIVIIGSLLIWNNERTGTYGYYYNPPLEFHAWVQLFNPMMIIDFGLPGAIEKGMLARDHIGPILKDMNPVILCGMPLSFTVYEGHETLSEVDCKHLATKFSLDI